MSCEESDPPEKTKCLSDRAGSSSSQGKRSKNFFPFPDELLVPFKEIFSVDYNPQIHDKEIDECFKAMVKKQNSNDAGSSKDETSYQVPDAFLPSVFLVPVSNSESCVKLNVNAEKAKEPADKNIPSKESKRDSIPLERSCDTVGISSRSSNSAESMTMSTEKEKKRKSPAEKNIKESFKLPEKDSNKKSDLPETATHHSKCLMKTKSEALSKKTDETKKNAPRQSMSSASGSLQLSTNNDSAVHGESTSSGPPSGPVRNARLVRPCVKKDIRPHQSLNVHTTEALTTGEHGSRLSTLNPQNSRPSTSSEEYPGTSSSRPRRDSSDEDLQEKFRRGATKQRMRKTSIKNYLKISSPILDDFRKKKREDKAFRKSLERPTEGILVYPKEESEKKDDSSNKDQEMDDLFHGFDEDYDNFFRNILPSGLWSDDDECDLPSPKRKSSGACSAAKTSGRKRKSGKKSSPKRPVDKEHPFAFPDELIGPFNEVFAIKYVPHVHDKEIDEYYEEVAKKEANNAGSSKDDTSQNDCLSPVDGDSNFESGIKKRGKEKSPANKNIKVPCKKSKKDSATVVKSCDTMGNSSRLCKSSAKTAIMSTKKETTVKASANKKAKLAKSEGSNHHESISKSDGLAKNAEEAKNNASSQSLASPSGGLQPSVRNDSAVSAVSAQVNSSRPPICPDNRVLKIILRRLPGIEKTKL